MIQGAADITSAAPLFSPPMERLFEANVPRLYPSMTRTNCNYGDVGRAGRFIFDAVFPQTMVERETASLPETSPGSGNGKGSRVSVAGRLSYIE